MRIIKTDGGNKDFYNLCKKLDDSLNENVSGRTNSGINSLYNIDQIKDVFLMYDGERAIGSIALWYHDDKTCEIMRVFVEEDYRGQGIAGQLVNMVLELAVEKGYKDIHLRTWSSTPYSLRAYEKLGFHMIKSYQYADKFHKALPFGHLRVYMKKGLLL